MDPGAPEVYEIVGVAVDVHSRGIDVEAPPTFYLPAAQFPQTGLVVFVESAGSPAQVIAAARVAMRSVDPQLPLSNVMTLDAHVDAALARPRFLLRVFALFGASVFLLATLGLYGFMACAIAGRRRELAVRLAVGASPARVARHVVGEGLSLAVIGLACGLAASAIAASALRALWFGVAALDPLTFVSVAAAVSLVAAAAVAPPAWRASRVDPRAALQDRLWG
jgi:ABC-type antimicrobial peptide transport system permease subunit